MLCSQCGNRKWGWGRSGTGQTAGPHPGQGSAAALQTAQLCQDKGYSLRRKVLRSSQQSCLSNWCFNTSFPIYELVTILTYRTWVIRWQSSSTDCRKPCPCPAPVSSPSLQAACKPGQQCLMNLPSPFVLVLLENRRAAEETNVSCYLWMTWVSWHRADNCGTHSQNSPESGNHLSSASLCCFPRKKKKKYRHSNKEIAREKLETCTGCYDMGIGGEKGSAGTGTMSCSIPC